MIRSVLQFCRVLRGLGEDAPNPSELALQAEEFERRNAELAQAVKSHREAEAELRRAQTYLDRTQRLARIGSWHWSVTREELIDCSEAYAEIHGVSRSEIGERIKNQLEDAIHPDDREHVKTACRELEKSGSSYEIEYRIIRPDGEIRHVQQFGEKIFDDSGQLVETIGTLQDVTELRQAEDSLLIAHDELEQRVQARTAQLQSANIALREQVTERERAEAEREEREMLLQSTARNSKIGYGVWDEREHRYSNVSEEFAQMMGLTIEQFQARFSSPIEDFEAVHPEDRERYRAYDEAYNANPDITQIEYRLVKPDGEIVHVREVMQPIWNETGALIQSIITNQDITEQKLVEEQLRQAQKMEAVGQLTGGIAHDFNNLLAVIIGNLELVEGEFEQNSQASEWLDIAISAAERGAGLTQRLLAFSRKQALRPTDLDASALVHSMLDLLRRTIGERIEIELVGDAGLWQCLVDPNQLENAMLNLAINARDAMPAGGKLTITTSNTRIDEEYARARTDVAPGQYVLITVSDTGSGMPEDVRKRAFEPFYTTKDVGHGSGLGLSMVYGFIKQSGGHVNVESEVDAGTTIRLYLPRFSGQRAQEVVPNDASEMLKARGETVLIVEDDDELRSLLVRLLGSLGYGVLEANSGSPALEILRSPADVDLLLTDIVLPEKMSGIELVEEARREQPDLRVLYMSGYTEDAILHQDRLVDGAPFLPKPFRMAEVARAARNALADKKPHE
ncbi:MAG: PAS domain-containing protein [Deltaproteobacteria bacterium]|jgi:PAS domain S-box-containing protein|nr:PAS domain-containing protein [Deltaproteobacteria bacterium]